MKSSTLIENKNPVIISVGVQWVITFSSKTDNYKKTKSSKHCKDRENEPACSARAIN